MRKLCTFWSRKSECAAVLTGLHNGMQVSFLFRAGCGFLQHSESSVVRLFRFSLAFTSPFHPLIVHPSSLLPTGRRLRRFHDSSFFRRCVNIESTLPTDGLTPAYLSSLSIPFLRN